MFNLERCVEKVEDGTVYHYVEGEVYRPLQVDTDFETMTAHDIQKMAHRFVSEGMIDKIDIMHNQMPSGAKVVESFIARKDDPVYPEGSWILKVRMPEGQLWDDIKSGKYNGFSFQATTLKVPKTVLVDIAQIAQGETEPNTDTEKIAEHTHEYYVEFDSEGRVTFGVTTTSEGHAHMISGTVTTDQAKGHSHRFFVE